MEDKIFREQIKDLEVYWRIQVCIGGVISINVKIPKSKVDNEDVVVGREETIDRNTNSSVHLVIEMGVYRQMQDCSLLKEIGSIQQEQGWEAR